ncbi:hypothetical protein AB6A40_002340 [Gnathostoma spinigerum]|uniref:Protein arginine N-methyltransferase n=1 Tax=Gnathostoma spinigerum TaxID=75299 RepID=A0ABD6E8W0_9BILA
MIVGNEFGDRANKGSPIANKSTKDAHGLPSVVGWASSEACPTIDKELTEYCSQLGGYGYNFINHPIGGITREQWTPCRDESPPPIDLPDFQLAPDLWSTYVTCRVSKWIDCDSPNEWLASLSCREIEKELDYASYIPTRVLTLNLFHRDSPRLAEILDRWLWTKRMTFSIWVFIPTDGELLSPSDGEPCDVWNVWMRFRTRCGNYPIFKLSVGIRLCPNLSEEFLDPLFYNRWKAEPLIAFWIDAATFTSNSNPSSPVLPKPHSQLFSYLIQSLNQRVILSSENTAISNNMKGKYSHVTKCLIRNKMCSGHSSADDESDKVLIEYLGHPEYIDTLQIPLQPLADDLDSGTYATFEEDSVKYEKYGQAVELAIADLVYKINDGRKIIIMLLGAGRGPLMQEIINAERRFNEKNRSRHNRVTLDLIAVEKNASAMVTLRYRNKTYWADRVRLIESDMRELIAFVRKNSLPPPDIIVSELLGSFGDNELSPECLDGVTNILHKSTISIPQSYTNYVAPIQSVRMHQKVQQCCESKFYERRQPSRGRPVQGSSSEDTFKLPDSITCFDELYVVCLRSICRLDNPKPVFTFEHPNFQNQSNHREAVISFETKIPSELMGFEACFDAHLYGDITLSIVPGRHSKSMVSWFPALIPLRQLYFMHSGTKIDFHIERKIDEGGVWYEWFVELKDPEMNEVIRTPVQNKNGMSCYMRI